MGLFTVIDEDGQRGSRWWTQFINDNQRKGGGDGPAWRSGRWILRSRASRREIFRIEWSHPLRLRPELDLTMSVKPHRVQFHVSILGLGSWWVKFGYKRQEWLYKAMIEERMFGIRVGYIGQIAWIYFAFDDDSDMTGMMSYYQKRKAAGETLFFGGNRVQLTQGLLLKINLRLRDRLLGKTVYTEEVVRQEAVSIPMDGREYAGVWKLTRATWKRPRWPFMSNERVGSWIDVEHPPAFSGKGENSWDCGDDAIFGCGSQSLTPAGAVGDYIKAVLKSRERYGNASDPDAFLPKVDSAA